MKTPNVFFKFSTKTSIIQNKKLKPIEIWSSFLIYLFSWEEFIRIFRCPKFVLADLFRKQIWSTIKINSIIFFKMLSQINYLINKLLISWNQIWLFLILELKDSILNLRDLRIRKLNWSWMSRRRIIKIIRIIAVIDKIKKMINRSIVKL